MKVMLSLTREEIQREIPYKLICETKCSSRWNTGKRRRLYDELFSNSEKRAAVRLFKMAHKWSLTTGVPEEVMMSSSTYMLWHKLGMFCALI